MKVTAVRVMALVLVLSLSFAGLGDGEMRAEGEGIDGLQSPLRGLRTALAVERSLPGEGASSLESIPQPSQGLSSPPEPGLRLLRSDETGVVLELYTPDFQIEPQVTEDLACDLLGVAGYAATDEAGWPQLPVRGAMLGVPPQADVTLTVVEVDAEALPGRYDLCPVPSPIVETEPTGEIRYQGVTWVRDAQAYATDVLSPTSPAELVSTGFIRSQRVAQVRFQPFQYNPVSGELRHLRRIRVQLDFTAEGDQLTTTATAVEEGPFEEPLSQIVLNYDTARQWRARPEPAPPQAVFAIQDQPQYKISVGADGLYQVTPADLQAAGVDVSGVDPRTFRLSNQGQEVAIYVEGEADGSFDPGDVLLFYGQGINTKYTKENIYWLTWGSGNGLRMPTVDGTATGTVTTTMHFLTTLRLEEDHSYQSKYPSGPDNDHWFWNLIVAAGASASKNYPTTLQHLATAPLSATVRGLLKGYDADPIHHTQVYLNGYLVDDAMWAPGTEHAFETNVSQSCLIEGSNVISVVSGLSIANPQHYDYVLVNWFEVDYHATYATGEDMLFFDGDQAGTWEYQVTGFTTETLDLFDTTLPASPTRILNATIQPGSAYTLTFQQTITGEHHYLALAPTQRRSPLQIERDVSSNLHSAANGADYVIITHGDFYTATLPLAARRAAQGSRTVVVDVQDVYDEFSYGVFDPMAIHDFLAYAYANWVPPAPAYVLLVGDGNFDFKDNWGWGEPNYVPPYLADVDPYISETAADNRYVCVSGGDIFPDMHLGRLPVKTAAEASVVVAKILNYEQDPPPGDWNEKLLFVADNADGSGDFAALSDAVINDYVSAPYTTTRVYYGVTYTTTTGARAAIINAINQGRLLVNYIGHGSRDIWAQEHLFGISDVAALANDGRLPLMVPMTCSDGYFVIPSPAGLDLSSLGEAIVRAQGKGAIASWSPTGMGTPSGHDFLNRGLFEALFFDGVVQLGPATTQGKLYLYSNTGGYRDLIDTYVLLGDPALALNVLPADLSLAKAVDPPGTVQPGDTITYTLTYANAGPATAHHVVITDVLPIQLLDPTVVSAGAAITPRSGTRFVWDVADLAEGEWGIITIAATVSPTFTGVLANEASIAAAVVETNTANNTAGPLLTDVNVPDLAISKQGPDKARAGSLITYTLTYSNNGDAPAHQVVIIDVLPTQLLNPTVVSAGAAITPRPGTRFVWDVADLAEGEGGVVTITGIVSPTFSGIIANTAVIAAATAEANTADNTAGPLLTGVDIPDLAISKQGPDNVRAGSLITYTLTYSNAGYAPAHQVVITDVLPTQLLNPSVVSAGAAVTPRPGSRFVWDVADLAEGEGGVITITAAVSPTFTGVLANEASIAAATVEANTANNTAGPLLTGVNIPDLAISKEGPDEAIAGSVITYTLIYSNAGNGLAEQVVISDPLPAELLSPTVVSDGATITPRAGSRFVWDVADLMPGEGGRITITATLSPTFGGLLSNTATIATATSEFPPTNNAATLVTLIQHKVYFPLAMRPAYLFLPLVMAQ